MCMCVYVCMLPIQIETRRVISTKLYDTENHCGCGTSGTDNFGDVCYKKCKAANGQVTKENMNEQ